MQPLTVFTPTYNRAYCLDQCYKSLKSQSNKNFIWMIIDDGSSDNTKELITKWIQEGVFKIEYIFQENQGMHGAHNTAYRNIKTELNVCIDSDDYMPNDAIDNILKFWNKNKKNKYAGIIGLDAFQDGSLIGSKIPEHLKEVTLTELYSKYKVQGDKKIVLRTEIIKQFPPYPIYKNEKLVPLGSLYQMIEKNYSFLPLNKVLCIVEYLPDGSSNTILSQYLKSPNGFAYSRLVEIENALNFQIKLKKYIHLVANSLAAGNLEHLKKAPSKAMIILATPAGLLFHWYLNLFHKS